MRVSEFKSFTKKALPAGFNFMAVGKPGTGKSFVFEQVAMELGWDFIPLCTPLQSPVKVGGYPRPPKEEGGDATHCLFDGIARAFRATKPALLLWDDLGMGGGETLKSILDTVQFGRIDGRVLPDCVRQCAATNDVGHGADVQGLIEPMKTRWDTIIDVEPHVDDTVIFGLDDGWPTDLLAFLRNSPDALHDWKPSKSMHIDGACPRGWHKVARWIGKGIEDLEVIAGCVGKGRAAEYLAFRGLQKDLPDIDQVLLDPEHSMVPENPSARYLISMALASRLSASNFGQCLKYLNRLPQMFRVFSIRDAFSLESARKSAGSLPAQYQPIRTARDFVSWVVSEDGKAIQNI